MEKRGLLLLVLFFIPLVSAQTLELNNFVFEPLKLQLGDSFTVEGYTSIENGFVIVYIEKDETTREFSSVIQEGKFTIEGSILLHESEEGIPSGSYGVSVLIKDGFGHERFYEDFKYVDILTDLITEASLENDDLEPGDDLVVEGSVEYLTGDDVEGKVTIKFDEEEIIDDFSKGSFSVETTLKENIISGEHELIVIVEDMFGNINEDVLKFDVFPLEKSLSLKVFDSDLGPEEELRVQIDLIDQAGDLIDKNLVLVLYDVKGDEFFKDDFFSGDEYVYYTPACMSPGTWEVFVFSDELEGVGGFTVREKLSLDAFISDSNLILTNDGNVRYNQNVKILAELNEGERYEIFKRTGLEPNETVSINLLNDVDEGVYTIFVLDEVFNDVYLTDTRGFFNKIGDGLKSLTGNVVAKSGSSTSKWPVILVVIILIGLIFYSNKLRINLSEGEKRIFAHEKRKGEKFKTKLLELGKKKPRFKFGKASNSDVSHFKERILKDIREKEETKKESSKEEYLKGFLKREGERKNVSKDNNAFVSMMNKNEGFVNPMKEEEPVSLETTKSDFEKPFSPEEQKEDEFNSEEGKVEEFSFDVSDEEKDSPKDDGKNSLFSLFD